MATLRLKTLLACAPLAFVPRDAFLARDFAAFRARDLAVDLPLPFAFAALAARLAFLMLSSLEARFSVPHDCGMQHPLRICKDGGT